MFAALRRQRPPAAAKTEMLPEILPKLKGSILVIRFTRLGRMPPALYGTQILAEAELPVVVFEFDPGSAKQEISQRGYPRVRLGLSRLETWPRAIRSIALTLASFLYLARWIMQTGRPRLVIAHGTLELNLAVLLKIFFRIAFAVHVHEIFDRNLLTGFLKWSLRFEGPFLRLADFTIFPEINRQHKLQQDYRLTAPSFLVFNTPRLRLHREKSEIRSAHQLPARAFLILYMGGVDPRNAVEELVKSLALLPDDVHAVLTGWVSKEYQAQLVAIAEKLKVVSRTHILGVVEPNKWPYIDAADAAFCVYRDDETRTRWVATASNKITESISAGVPVLVLNTENFRTFLNNYPVGILVDAITPEAVAQSIRALYDDPIRRMTMRNRALNLHQNDLNYEKQFQPVLSLLKKKYFTKPTG